MKKEIIYIQAWANTTAKTWDDVMATKHEVENAGEVAQSIANVMGCQVRMTRHMNGVKIGSLNGSYFNPQAQTLYSPSVALPAIEKKHTGHNAFDRENQTY